MNQLINAANQFRMYESDHKKKAEGFAAFAAEYEGIAGSGSSPKSREQRELEAASLAKAQANAMHATQLEALAVTLESLHSVAMDPGNAHANHYLRGMANGMELLMATLEQREPNYVPAEAVAPDNGFDRVKHFHQAFSLPVNEPGYVPTVEERLLRGRLFLEEGLEHLCAGLGLALVYGDEEGESAAHIDERRLDLADCGRPYNPVETLDGLADAKVILNGTGVAFGLPVPAADTMVYESNMSKLDEDGKPIINGVTPGYRGGVDFETNEILPEGGYRLDLPHGKVLKPAHYVAPDIASLLK